MEQKIITKWMLRRITDNTTYEAMVPGSVLQTLEENGIIPNPFVADNEKYALKIMEEDFEYSTEFDASPEMMTSQRRELVFEGIDTIADVTLNGEKILHAENMHRTYRLDVSGLLKEKNNILKVYLYSPINYIRDSYKTCECDGAEDAMEGFANIRKAHYMFGWDWGARIPDAGIFRPVTVLGIDKARIKNVSITQRHFEDKAGLLINIDEEIVGDNLELVREVRITGPLGKEIFIDDYTDKKEIIIDDPMLWWPNGYGEQNLYTVTVALKDAGVTVDEMTKKIGLRTITLTRKKDEWGESFSHCVNGVDIFAMGADYIPEDNYLGRITPDRTRKLLSDCRMTNFNTIRIWGGGFFPSDEFYDICDEMGFIVWQDLMFACAVYDLNDDFEENIHAEIRDNLLRIADHACIGLICGNNEMEMFVKSGLWVKTHKQKADYIKMYEYLFPKWVLEYAPGIQYWPSSPSSGGSFDDPGDENRGDVHYWAVWHDNKPFTEFRKHYFRYLSEFGFQSLPSKKTLETVMTGEEDYNLFSYNMEKHQRNSSANAKIMQYMQATFKYPTDFDTLSYASQLLAGEAIRYGVEHFRRNRGRCMGAVYWQLNDCWPVISWASIDYTGRWKALQYYARRFFAPVLVSCEETSTVSEGIGVNSEKTFFTPKIRLNVSNETRSDKHLVVEWELRNAKGDILENGAADADVSALSAYWVLEKAFADADIYENFVSYRAREKATNETVSEGSVLFVPAKYFRFEKPELSIICDSPGEIRIKTDAFAKNVEIRNENDDLVLSDNFFDLLPGEKVIKVYRGEAKNLCVRSVYDIR